MESPKTSIQGVLVIVSAIVVSVYAIYQTGDVTFAMLIFPQLFGGIGLIKAKDQ